MNNLLIPPIADDVNDWFINKDISGLCDKTIKLLNKIHANGPCLDIGCGSGYFALNFSERNNTSVTGIDIYRPFIDHANKIAQSQNLQCNFILSDVKQFLQKEKANWELLVALAVGEIFGDELETFKYLFNKVKVNGIFAFGWTEVQSHAVQTLEAINNYLHNSYGVIVLQSIERYRFDYYDNINNLYCQLDNVKPTHSLKQHLKDRLFHLNNRYFQSTIIVVRKEELNLL